MTVHNSEQSVKRLRTRNYGARKVCLSTPLSDVPNLSLEKCFVAAGIFCVFEIFCEVLQTSQKILEAMLDCCPSYYFLGFMVKRTSFMVPDRHFTLLLDLKMQMMKFHDNPGTTISTKFSILQSIFLPRLVRCSFQPLAHSKVYPCSSKSFPSDSTEGVSSSNCSYEKRKIMYKNLFILAGLHFSSGRYTVVDPGSPQSFQISWTKILVPQHAHRCSRIQPRILVPLKFLNWTLALP